MSNDSDSINYQRLCDDAMRSMVAQILRDAQKNGLPSNHHFYITLVTSYPGVVISDNLRSKYPNEVTIVLQHQFYGLNVLEKKFTVTLSFFGVSEQILIPFDSIVKFVDPYAKFELQFDCVIPIEEIMEENSSDVKESKNKVISVDFGGTKQDDDKKK